MPDIIDNTKLLDSMLDFLPPCFNVDPDKELAFTILSASQVEIKDLELRIWTSTSVLPDHRVSLDGKTIAEVAAEVDAFSGVSVEGGTSTASALRLLRSETTDGRIYMFTSALWAIFQAFALEVGELFGGIKEGLRQITIPGSTDSMQDFWGTYFDVKRRRLEQDPNYGQRILMTIQIPRSNNVAMEETLKFALGLDTIIIDLGYSVGSFMLMNDAGTPMHDPDYYIWNIGMGPAEPCTFGIVLQPGDFSSISGETFSDFRDLIYSIKESGTRPKLIFTDAPGFMLMNNTDTPMHNVNWPLYNVNDPNWPMTQRFQQYNQYYAMFI